MLKLPSMLELLQAGVHFGHKTARRHPKMMPYIFGERGGINIIDLDRTLSMAKTALGRLQEIAARGGTILFVGTKKQVSDTVRREAEGCGMPYVTNRWLGGTFTNFSEVSNQIRRHHDLKDKQESGVLARKYTKKEQVVFLREIDELEKKVGGIKSLRKLPDAIVIIDCKKEKTALREAKSVGVPVFALLDTNVNPEDITYGIPANDDAVKTINMMVHLFAEAVKAGQAHPLTERAAAAGEVPAKTNPVGQASLLSESGDIVNRPSGQA
ncbi:30S ribosomal protein S2 [Candidatus Uhrbacteria bacterium CG_4_10_14_0_8_um_filter_58_22]|uniref:Small ribosomal subunit protein uS2 n=1 Tax=Candidatus Uhrbacteria bacterium CG_4_10_14_0_8_um_filter_58_22 TaxID=1975029 RepID=A0A2M7QBW3_9BACT|nr:MAG: 30S ribosomal protein S2 [Candidatus Uhrbacteria bacterium CG_4_10_14_0_8_um_filter_58_22]